MLTKHPYSYKMFSRRNGKFNQLEQYRDTFIQFYQKQYSDPEDFQENIESVDYGLAEEWVGVALAFFGETLIGFMNFNELDEKRKIFEVGFAFVEEEHRKKGVWTKMSGMVEKEAKQMGAKYLRREISYDDEFLAKHLMQKEHYKPPSNDPEDWKNKPLSRRL